MYLQIELLCHLSSSGSVILNDEVTLGWFVMIDSCKSSRLCMPS